MTTPLLLLVEDNPSDAELFITAMREQDPAVQVQVVGNGEQALCLLRREPPFQDAALPDLILVDLKLPSMDGAELIRRLRDDPRTASLRTALLTTYDVAQDPARWGEIPADEYLIKPTDWDRFLDLADFILSTLGRDTEHLPLEALQPEGRLPARAGDTGQPS